VEIVEALKNRCGCKTVNAPQDLTASGLNQCAVFETDRGKFFVKMHRSSPLSMYEAEAKGLELLFETRTLRVPKAYCSGEGTSGAFLIMEYLELFPHSEESQRKLGKQLALMHREKRASRYGFEVDNTIGTTPQINSWNDDWVEFFLVNRLEFQLRLIEEKYEDTDLRRAAEPLLSRFASFFKGIEVYPSLLHGDLWGGNTARDENGQPVIFDPAVYYGHHEAEFGILMLFGGFSQSFFEAYDEVLPREEGFDERHRAYKLYHLLNHYTLFGSSYRAACCDLLRF